MYKHICILFLLIACGYKVKTQDFLNKWDFDGDGKNDSIKFDYSGGAHCCYTMNLKLSSKNKWEHFSYEMDGGYGGSIDGRYPGHFNIKNYDDDSLPEIFMYS